VAYIDTPPTDVKLDEEAAIIQRECAAADLAGLDRINHAIEAGKHGNKVNECIPRRFRRWLKQNGLKKSTMYNYMLLARYEESVHRCGHTSIHAALCMIRKQTPSNKQPKDKETLVKHWKRESEAARTEFLDEIGIDEFRLAMSLAFYRRIRDLVRVEKATSNPDSKGTMLLKKALSHVRTADAPGASETAVAADLAEAMVCLRMLLRTLRNDPTNAVFGISAATATKKKKAAA
jgi:hypothetical protein